MHAECRMQVRPAVELTYLVESRFRPADRIYIYLQGQDAHNLLKVRYVFT